MSTTILPVTLYITPVVDFQASSSEQLEVHNSCGHLCILSRSCMIAFLLHVLCLMITLVKYMRIR